MSEDRSAFSSLASRQPRTGVPFLESFRVHHGPPGLLGRFFPSAVRRLQERGISLAFITFEELVSLSERNPDNWGSFNPMFDPRFADIPQGSLCLAGYDASGEIKICICAKPFDASRESFGSIVNAGGFASIRPDKNVEQIETRMSQSFAYDMHGLLGYVGALWVHPDARGGRFASIFGYIINACLLTLWNPSYLLGSVQHSTVGTGLFQRYGYPHSMSSLIVTSHGKQAADLTILYMTRDEFTEGLATYLDEIWPKIDAAVASGNRQQSA